jgi:HrpA-like RNA helicase
MLQCPLYKIPGRLYPVDIIYCDVLEGKDMKKCVQRCRMQTAALE